MILQWEHNDRPEFRSSGTLYTYTGGVYSGAPTTELQNPSEEQSGVDWHIAMTKVEENGVFAGYVAVGYVGWSMWGPSPNNCLTPSANPDTWFPPVQIVEQGDATGGRRMAVARYAADGTLLWYRAYHDDILFGVIQDSNGDIVVTGLGKGDLSDVYEDMAGAPPLYVNPTIGQTPETFGSIPCAGKSHMLVMKLDLEDGDILWNHYYGDYTTIADVGVNDSRGYDLVETANGGYRVVGRCNSSVSTGGGASPLGLWRPLVVQLDNNGQVQWLETLLTEDDDAATPELWTVNAAIVADYRNIDRMTDIATSEELFVITGERNNSSFVQFFREPAVSSGYVEPEWTKDIDADDTAFPPPLGTIVPHAPDIAFHENGNGSIIWPVYFDKGPYTAEGMIYLLDPADGEPVTSASIGEMHAFDRKIGVVSMTNGNIGVCSTKHPTSYSVDGLQYGWGDLTAAARDCFLDVDWPTAIEWSAIAGGG